ncbi:YtxH domain-containing protein [Weeksellaceae bacterium KMM 9713]|uniref:YtxH domain-containing protein n=1 Tax=Profundicola chukchiensis TaxID=2961959 RepID=A0A9X4RX81_9FLAO|nr:YtxH domain-containing protein [Profundicola chukchiensis]MDG4945809.1 YtxH domain-containing protein [Profundicola chukchiensis]MDG4951507.1 YtxH domain-containing protein [Profundicola chukchiensis]
MKKRNGLLALLGIGALAFWKYKKMSPEEQENVKGQINEAKRKFTDAGQDIKSKVEDKFNQAKSTVEEKVDDLKKDVSAN